MVEPTGDNRFIKVPTDWPEYGRAAVAALKQALERNSNPQAAAKIACDVADALAVEHARRKERDQNYSWRAVFTADAAAAVWRYYAVLMGWRDPTHGRRVLHAEPVADKQPSQPDENLRAAVSVLNLVASSGLDMGSLDNASKAIRTLNPEEIARVAGSVEPAVAVEAALELIRLHSPEITR